jgi:hypothetical protein
MAGYIHVLACTSIVNTHGHGSRSWTGVCGLADANRKIRRQKFTARTATHVPACVFLRRPYVRRCFLEKFWPCTACMHVAFDLCRRRHGRNSTSFILVARFFLEIYRLLHATFAAACMDAHCPVRGCACVHHYKRGRR